MTGHLEAIEQYVAAINLTLPEGSDGEGPIRQALGEIVAEATALDSALDSLRSSAFKVDYELRSMRAAAAWCRKELERQP